MKRISILCIITFAFVPSQAQRVIDLPSAGMLTGTELVSVSIGGTGTRKTTAQDIANLAQAGDFIAVSTITDRNIIANARRKVGLHAYVAADTSTYILVGGINNINWRKVSSIGGLGGSGDNNFPNSLSFDIATGILSLGRNDLSSLTAPLDGRYISGSLTTGYIAVSNGGGSITNSPAFIASGNVGIGTLSPSKKLHVVGGILTDGLYANIVNVTANYMALPTDHTIACNGNFDVALPNATNNAKLILIIINTGSGTITVDPFSSQTINSVTTVTLSTQWATLQLQSDGANWLNLNP